MDFIRSFIESYLPPNYSAHGHHVDNLIIWTHYLMFVLFVVIVNAINNKNYS